MAIEVSWLVEDRIMQWHITGTASPSEIRTAEMKALGMLENVQSRVHMVFDVEGLQEMPPLAAYFQHKWILPRDSRLGWNVFVGLKNPVHRLSISVLANLFNLHMEMVHTQSAAFDFLGATDSTLTLSEDAAATCA